MGNTIYATGQTYLLELGGQPAGTLHSFTQGNLVADPSQGSSSNAPKTTQFSMSDSELSCGAGMNRLLQEWIRNALDRSYARKDGSVTVLDVNQQAMLSMDFNNALITGFSTPALDRSAKGSDYFTISFRPEVVKVRSGQRSFDPKKLPQYGLPPRPVNTGKYKLAIDGLDKECADVTKINSLSFKQGVASDNPGTSRSPNLEPGKIEESDLVLTTPAAALRGFYDWFTSVMTQGSPSRSDNKNGSLEYFAADSDKPDLRLEFNQLGIKSLSLPRKDDFKSHDPAKIVLYYDSIKLSSH